MSKRLEQMRWNPKADWRIEDVQAVCKEFDISCERSRAGSSHYKITHAPQIEILTIPFKRPIKPVYIRKLLEFVEAVRNARDLS
ncbi:hypothetical protein [Phyllobacterium zundukense]|uniref:Type II toxin-antitoxin system HicA family toxin n=1 Tax=Phyllobacterium zundukense TaxID=1867719 RepID=A0A2N9W3P6_9HYPH|nr:hypothetical protein [Phyllobacterium zundukense]PIO46364.1 hypothetical protein B5P45_00725 [Phyllobacterium zundukense]